MPRRGVVDFYALSTCIWCRRTRDWLEENGVPYRVHYMDLLEGEEKWEALREMERHVSRVSYPILIAEGGDIVIQGYHPDQFEEDLT